MIKNEFFIIASVDYYYETYCFDGVIAARLHRVNGPEKIRLEVRDQQEKLSVDY